MKKTWIILLAIAMMLALAAGCANAKAPEEPGEEIGKGSASSEININVQGVTLDQLNMFDPSEGATFKRPSIDMDSLVSADNH